MSNDRFIKNFATAAFFLVSVYLIVSVAVLILAGYGKVRVDNSVLVLLIASAIANVLAFFYYFKNPL